VAIKSMPVFFIDNQQMWPADAKLHGSIVLWPDNGKYPTFAGVAIANHPEFDGKIVVQAGNRGLIVSLLPGAQSQNDIRTALSAKQAPEQYRIAVDAIIHSVMLAREDAEGGGDCHPFALLAMLAKSSPKEARLIAAALRVWMAKPGAAAPSDVQSAEEIVSSIESTLAETPK
jgi:hypothetical protein